MIYTITKKGNYGVIDPIPKGSLSKTIDKYLRYEKKGIEFMPNRAWGIVKFYKEKKGVFPWGLITTVKKIFDKYCETKGDTYNISYYPKNYFSKLNAVDYIEGLRDYQKEAIKALIQNNGGIIVLPTASGKTITMIEYLKLMGLKSLVIVPTLDIKRQWQEYKLSNVTVSTYQNPKLKNEITNYELILVDEMHHTPANSIYTLLMNTNTSSIIVGCSATAAREDGEEMKMFAALGDIVYKKSRTELISKGWLANAEVIYLKPKFKTDGKYKDYQTVYKTEIVENGDRNERIIEVALREWQRGRKILVLVSQIEHGQKLFDDINLLNIYTPAPKIIFMHGKSKDREQDMNKYDIIIATSIYDEGWNLPALDVLVLAAGGSSSIKLTQRIGRVLRLKPDGRSARIYDFIDTPKYLRRHYLVRRNILEKEFKITEQDDVQTRLL